MLKTGNTPEEIEDTLSGPGILKVVEDAVKTRSKINLVVDRNALGKIVRVGYYLTSGEINVKINPLKYIPMRDIVVTSKKQVKLEKNQNARLDVKSSHPKSYEKHFYVTFPIGVDEARIRCIFRAKKDNSNVFVIMLDKKVNTIWKSIYRYDCAHGFIHKDKIDGIGINVVKKEKLPTQNKIKAIKFIINEIIKDLETQGQKEVPELEIRRAEKQMLKLFFKPELNSIIKSNLVIFSELIGPFPIKNG